jgi:hypothetical protein
MNKTNNFELLYSNIRKLRKYREEKISTMSLKLGYANESVYSKFERGKFAKLDIDMFINVCMILEVCPFYLLYVSNVNLFEINGCNQTWQEFISKLPQNIKLPPPPNVSNHSDYKL